MRIFNKNIRGSKIAGYQIKAVRMVSVTVIVKAGSQYENKNQQGYFHLLEHLMMTGTEKFGSFKELSNYQEEHGIRMGATTSRNQMVFWFDFPDIYISESLILIEEILFHSKINFDNIENEISIIEQEYNDCWNNPYNRFNFEIEKRLAGEECNLINDVLGTPESIKTATRKELTGLYKKYFQPNNMCWGISGNFDWNKIGKLLNKIIPSKNTQKKETKFVIKNWKPSFEKIIYKSRIEQPYIWIYWQMPSSEKYSMTKKYGLNLFNYMIGSGKHSFIVNRIRQELGLAYGIGSVCIGLGQTFLFLPSIFRPILRKLIW
jgi:predicted Zn-dependent peptidase